MPLLLGTSLLACDETLSLQVPARVDAPLGGLGQHHFEVGAAREDLTPIPGIPLGGYSVEGKVSRGFWTRLFARAIYMQDDQGKALALVTTDLMIMPSGLPDRVVELLHDANLEQIGRENLLLSATESHQSPGNYFSSKLYNAFSSAQEGFDPELFEFLARRIATAIEKAHQQRQEALLETSHFTGPMADADVIDRFVRNRSFDAFQLDPEAGEILAANATRLSSCPVADADWPRELYPDPRACRAVHARVDLLRFTAKNGGAPIALAVFVPTHITVLDADTEVYSGDVFELASLALEARIAKGVGCGANAVSAPVVGIFNGAQGDVSLWWRRRTAAQARELADQLANHVCGRLKAGLQAAPVDPQIAYQFDIVPVDSQPFDDAHGYPRSTDRKPLPGAAEFGGAEDQRTVFYDLGQKEGVRHHVRRAHGAKHAPLTLELFETEVNPVGAALSIYRPPRTAPIGVYKVGDVVLVGFPSEPTTVMGRRIRQTVAQALGLSSADQVLLVSFANGHISYVTTPQEYDRQDYEGASDYWGAGTGPFLRAQIGRLAADLASGSAPPKAWSQSYTTGATRRFEPRNTWGSTWDPDEGLSHIAVGGALDDPTRGLPTYCWRDAIPSLETGTPACARVVPDVYVREVPANAIAPAATLELGLVPQDNWHARVVTVMTAVSREETEWCAVWLRPEQGILDAQACRFDVDRIGGGSLQSPSFPCATGAPPARPTDVNGQVLPPLVPNDGSAAACKLGLASCSSVCMGGGL